MIVDYKFSNYASFYDENCLSFEINADRSYVKENTIETSFGRLNKSLFIFGPNGSGKTNCINSLAYMIRLVTAGFEVQSKLIALENHFLFNLNGENKEKSFEVSFIIDDVMYIYGFAILNCKIHKEYLYKKIKRKTMIFERISPSYKDIKVTNDFENVKQLIQNTREDVLFLSWANVGNNELAMKIYRWFDNIEIIDGYNTNKYLTKTINYIESDDANKEKILHFLNDADLNVDGFDIELNEDEERNKWFLENIKNSEIKEMDIKPDFKTVKLNILHKYYGKEWTELGKAKTDISLESNGTKKLFELAGPIIDAMEKGKILFIDEIDSMLHPIIVNKLINEYNLNTTGAQLICTTHDVLLLDEKIRKDQIWFTKKDKFGVSKLVSLASKKGIRKNSKISKQYLNGDFKDILE